MVTEFILIRHGESLGNAKKLYIGHIDMDLSEKGRAQAKSAAEYFKNEKISAIYSSDLKRAYNTALAHTEYRDVPVIKSKELREVYLGDWEGNSIEEIHQRWYNEFEIGWKQKFGSLTLPNGEAVYNAGKRMHDKLLEIAKKEDGTVLITAHAAIIRAFWCYAQGVEPSEWAEFVPFPSNASASFVSFDGSKLIPIRYSFDDYITDKTFVDA